LGPAPVVEEEAAALEKAADPLEVLTLGVKNPRSRGPRMIGLPRSG
jgi:hypothetical protein